MKVVVKRFVWVAGILAGLVYFSALPLRAQEKQKERPKVDAGKPAANPRLLWTFDTGG
jgi:hypothetical protein